MEVDGNKEKGANKETIEGNQIAPKIEEGLLCETFFFVWFLFKLNLPPPPPPRPPSSFIMQP
jgi:hypothetical protein